MVASRPRFTHGVVAPTIHWLSKIPAPFYIHSRVSQYLYDYPPFCFLECFAIESNHKIPSLFAHAILTATLALSSQHLLSTLK